MVRWLCDVGETGQVVLDDTLVDVETGAALLTTQCTTNTVHSSFRKQVTAATQPLTESFGHYSSDEERLESDYLAGS